MTVNGDFFFLNTSIERSTVILDELEVWSMTKHDNCVLATVDIPEMAESFSTGNFLLGFSATSW